LYDRSQITSSQAFVNKSWRFILFGFTSERTHNLINRFSHQSITFTNACRNYLSTQMRRPGRGAAGEGHVLQESFSLSWSEAPQKPATPPVKKRARIASAAFDTRCRQLPDRAPGGRNSCVGVLHVCTRSRTRRAPERPRSFASTRPLRARIRP